MYPDVTDFAQYLLDAKVISAIPDPIPASWETLLNAAIQAFEKETGWMPFIASETPETRTFRTDSFLLQLPTGAVEVEEVAVGDKVLESSQYLLTPFAPPYLSIEFRSKPYDLVHVTGIWGYAETLPDDVRLAILQHAADALRDSQSGVSGALTRVKQDDVEYAFADVGNADESLSNWRRVVNRYKRVIV